MSAETDDRNCLNRHEVTGQDATGPWCANVEIVHDHVVANVYRSKRYAPNARMTLDEAEEYFGSGMDLVHNERARRRIAERGA